MNLAISRNVSVVNYKINRFHGFSTNNVILVGKQSTIHNITGKCIAKAQIFIGVNHIILYRYNGLETFPVSGANHNHSI